MKLCWGPEAFHEYAGSLHLTARWKRRFLNGSALTPIRTNGIFSSDWWIETSGTSLWEVKADDDRVRWACGRFLRTLTPPSKEQKRVPSTSSPPPDLDEDTAPELALTERSAAKKRSRIACIWSTTPRLRHVILSLPSMALPLRAIAIWYQQINVVPALEEIIWHWVSSLVRGWADTLTMAGI